MTNVNISSNAPGRIFFKAFNHPDVKEIEFNEAWSNGTGYFDKACKGEHAPVLNAGEIVKSTDTANRRLLIIGTRMGNVVVFDRFSNQEDGGVYVTNAPSTAVFLALLSGSSVGESEMLTILGGWGDISDNIGRKIEKMAKQFAIYEKKAASDLAKAA